MCFHVLMVSRIGGHAEFLFVLNIIGVVCDIEIGVFQISFSFYY